MENGHRTKSKNCLYLLAKANDLTQTKTFAHWFIKENDYATISN
jgi:hypothetical protein